jgi:hypothetical protein
MSNRNDKEDAMGALDDSAQSFSAIRNHIHAHSSKEGGATSRLLTIIDQIEQEVKQGSSANLAKIERGLDSLENLSPETLDVTIQALLTLRGNALEGVRSIIQKKKEKRQQAKPSQQNILEGKWMDLRRSSREKWDDLTDEEWDQISNRRDRWSDVLQEKYGYSEIEAEREIDDFLKRWNQPGGRTTHGPDLTMGNLPGEPTTDGPDPD